MTACGSVCPEDSFSQFACIFLIAVASEDDDETFTMDTGNHDPGDHVDLVQEISDDYQHIRCPDPPDMNVESAFADLHLGKGDLEIIQFG